MYMCTCYCADVSPSKEKGEKGEADGATEKEKSKADRRPIITHIPELPPR